MSAFESNRTSTSEARTQRERSKCADLPNKPGIYRFYNSSNKIIYVGKAKDLQKRVSQYFRKNIRDQKTKALMSHVVNFNTIITNNENQALLLECNLIKEHHPKYNILLRDDKSYPYLFLSMKSDFPRLDYHRGTKKQPGRYFGPYPNAGSVRDNLALIQKLFKIRQCSDIFFNHRTRPCLQYQIDRCTAPCVHCVSKENYAQQVRDAIDFLEGKNKSVIKSLENRMQKASVAKEYEKAAQLRDVVMRLRKLQEQQVVTGGKGNIDVFGAVESRGQIAITVISIRNGQMLGQKTFFPSTSADTTIEEALSAFIPQYYLNPERSTQLIDRIILSHAIEDREWIQNVLRGTENQTAPMEAQAPAKPQPCKKFFQIKTYDLKKKNPGGNATHEIQLLKLAIENANEELQRHQSTQKNIEIKIESLQKALHLPNKPERIECFDISHTMGEFTKASCVVFGVDGPIKKMYRHFNVGNITPGDDYGAMAQVLTRRYTALKKNNLPLPDLIIVDGGRGQLKIAATVLESLQISGVMLMGVAKGVTRKAGVEKLWIWGHDAEVELSENNPARHLIQQIRDEAHRFAITAHRSAMRKKRTT